MKLIALIASLFGCEIEEGPLSTYWPGDGYNAGELACGGKFEDGQEHVAIRRIDKFGCRRRVFVFSFDTYRGRISTVRDSGPFGATCAGNKIIVETGKIPKTCKRRAIADLSWALWEKLGKPKFLTNIILIYLPKGET